MTGGRILAAAALAAAAAALFLGAAPAAEAHPNPSGSEDSKGRPAHSEADQLAQFGSAHYGHVYPDYVTDYGDARYMWVYHYRSCWDFTAREPHDPDTIAVNYGRNENKAGAVHPDGFQTVEYMVAGARTHLQPGEDYYVQASDGSFHCHRSPEFTAPASGDGTRHYLPRMEITDVTAGSVTVNALFKNSGSHTFAVSTSDSVSDVVATGDIPHVRAISSGALDEMAVTITGLDSGQRYYVFASNASGMIGATSSRSTVSFVAADAPALALGPLPTLQAEEGMPLPYEIPVSGGNPDEADYTYSISPSNLGAGVNETGHFNWTPGEDRGGMSFEFNITVSNEPYARAVTETLAVEVAESNQSPVIRKAMGVTEASPDAAYNFWPGEDNAYEFPFEAEDADAPKQAVTFSIASQDPPGAGAVINPLTGVLRWTAGAAGDSVNVTVVATDNSSAANADSAPVHKNLVAVPPDSELRFVPDRIRSIFAEKGLPRMLEVPTAGGNPDTADFNFTLGRNDGRLDHLGLSMDSFTHGGRGVGILPIDVPAGTTESRVWLRIDVSNGTAQGEELSLRVNIAPAEGNAPPALSFHPAPPYAVTAGEPFSLFAGAADRETQEVSYEISGHDAPGAGPSIDRSFGLIEWTPEEAGTFSIAVNATDDHATDPMHALAAVAVEVLPAPPSVTGISASGASATFGIYGGGRDAQARLADSGGGAIGAASAEGLSLSFSVAGLEDGEAYFVQIRTPPDGWDAASTAHYRYVHPNAGDPVQPVTHDPPEIATPLTGHTATAGVPFSLPLEATDGQADDAVTFTIEGEALGATVAGTGDLTATFSWGPNSTHVGNQSFAIRATDSDLQTDTVTLEVAVAAAAGSEPANRAPELTSPIGPLSATVGMPLEGFDANATDPDGDALTFEISWAPGAAPAGASFDGTTGVLEWTPRAGQEGAHTATVTATDGTLSSAPQAVAITVGPAQDAGAAPANRAPVIAPAIGAQAVPVGETLTVDADATDPDGDTVTFALDRGTSPALPATATFDESTGVLEWAPNATEAGTYSVAIIADDGNNNTDREPFTITVEIPADVDDADSAAAISAVIAAAADGATVTFAAGSYADKGPIIVGNDNVTLAPAARAGGLATEQADPVVFRGTTSLRIHAAHVAVHGFDFQAGASGAAVEAIRANVTEGLSVRDNEFVGYLSGVAVIDDSDIPYGAHPEWNDQGNRDVCLIGLEECPERTSDGGREYAGHVVSSTAEVTENSFTNMVEYTVANLADGALNAKRNHHGGGAAFGGVIVEPWYADAGRTEPAVLGGDSSGTGSGPATAGLSLVGGTGDGGTGAPAPAPAPAPPRRSGGGGGGGGGGGPAVIAGSASDVYISSVEWDCAAGAVSIAAGPDSAGLVVTVRTPALGVRQAEATGSAGGLRTFGAAMAEGDDFLMVQAISLRPGATLTASESVNIGECSGRAEFGRAPAEPAARPDQPPAGPAPGAPEPQPTADVLPPPGAPEQDTGMADESEPAPGQEQAPGPAPAPAPGGGCLIATAAHGTEAAGQVQLLRQVRDGAVMQTGAGASFMAAFSSVYYSFSPAVADLEREHPLFREAVKAALAPMLHSMSLMSHAEPGSEQSVLALGLSVAALNLGMYAAAPAAAAQAARMAVTARRRRACARRPRGASS